MRRGPSRLSSTVGRDVLFLPRLGTSDEMVGEINALIRKLQDRK